MLDAKLINFLTAFVPFFNVSKRQINILRPVYFYLQTWIILLNPAISLGERQFLYGDSSQLSMSGNGVCKINKTG